MTSKMPLDEMIAAGGKKWNLRLTLIVSVIAILAGAGWLVSKKESGRRYSYQTEPLERGTLTLKVSATGNLQPTNQVDVGSELSGTVEKVFVDDNDRVVKGQLLAQLDPARLKDAVTRAEASLQQARSVLTQSEAATAESTLNLERLLAAFRLSGGKIPSTSELDQARSALAKLKGAESAARAGVDQAKAVLQTEKTSLTKGSIRAPINGVVLKRSLEPGQTVAASLQAPVLFTLAEDLSQMELLVDVDEADISKVKAGQQAFFTVDAWPGRRFQGRLVKVGLGSQKKENVVSYQAKIEVSNRDLALRPGMTANAEIIIERKQDALLAPAAALRFTPQQQAAEKKKGNVMAMLMPRPPVAIRKAAQHQEGAPSLWVLRQDVPVPLPVTTGSGNGKVTEVTGAGLEPGIQVIVAAESVQP